MNKSTGLSRRGFPSKPDVYDGFILDMYVGTDDQGRKTWRGLRAEGQRGWMELDDCPTWGSRWTYLPTYIVSGDASALGHDINSQVVNYILV